MMDLISASAALVRMMPGIGFFDCSSNSQHPVILLLGEHPVTWTSLAQGGRSPQLIAAVFPSSP
jgi:hypothetical protein